MELIYEVIIHGFLIGVLILGVFHARRSTVDSYTAQTNKVSVLSLVATLVGTSFGGGVIVGMVTMGFEAGVVGVIVAASYFLGFIVLALLAGKIRSALGKNNRSLLDYLEQIYGLAVRKTAALIFSVVLFLFASAQFVALASFIHYFFEVGFYVAIIASAAYLIIYTALGGFRSVLLTDKLQFFLMLITSVLLVGPVLITQSPVDSLKTLPSDMLDGTAYGLVFLAGAILFLWPTLLARIDIWQRIRSARSLSVVRKAFTISGFVIFLSFSFFTVVGMLARAHGGLEAETAIFQYVELMLPEYGMTVVFLAILAAVMSSGDSILNVLAISVSDLFQGRSQNSTAINNKQKLLKLRIATVIVGIITVVVAFVFPDIVDLNIGGISTVLIFVVPIIAGLFGWRLSSRVVLISIISGFAVIVAAFPFMPTEAFVPGFVVSLLVLIGGHFLTRRKLT